MIIDFKITANDQDITDKIKQNLISLSITDTVGDHADGLNIRLSDPEQNILFPKESSKINVQLGYKDDMQNFGYFFVDTVQYDYPPSTIQINANSVPFVESTTYTAMQTQKTRSFDLITIKELTHQLASEHGLDTAIVPEVGNIMLKHIDQTNEGNITFLYRVIRQYGGVLKPTHTKLIVLKKDGHNASNNQLPTITLDIEDITKLSYSEKQSDKFKRVVAQYHDSDTGETKQVKAGNGQPEFMLSNLYETEQAAQAIAENVLKGYANDSSSLNITLIGNKNIIAGVPLQIANMRKDIPTNWIVKTVVHSISKMGYQTNALLR